MRKPAFCRCEIKDADQLRGNREADQRLCFRYISSTIPLLPKYKNFKPLAILCGCTAWFVWDLVENPEDRFSNNEAHIIHVPLITDNKKVRKSNFYQCHMSSVARKPVFLIFDQI